MSNSGNSFENLKREHDAKQASEKSFGYVFTAFFTLVGIWPALFGGSLRIWSLALAVVFLVITFVKPSLFKPLNKVWMAFGELLHKIMNPLIMGLMFLIVFVPIGLLLKLFGVKLLPRTFDKDAKSYWVIRSDETQHTNMQNQF